MTLQSELGNEIKKRINLTVFSKQVYIAEIYKTQEIVTTWIN